MKDKGIGRQGKLIAIMAVIILLLVGVILYSFAVRPMISGYVVNKQVQAQNLVVSALVKQIQETGYVQIPVGEDQVLTLVPYQPQEQQVQQGQPVTQEVAE